MRLLLFSQCKKSMLNLNTVNYINYSKQFCKWKVFFKFPTILLLLFILFNHTNIYFRKINCFIEYWSNPCLAEETYRCISMLKLTVHSCISCTALTLHLNIIWIYYIPDKTRFSGCGSSTFPINPLGDEGWELVANLRTNTVPYCFWKDIHCSEINLKTPVIVFLYFLFLPFFFVSEYNLVFHYSFPF